MAISILLVDDNPDTLNTYMKAVLLRFGTAEGAAGLFQGAAAPFVRVVGADTFSLAVRELENNTYQIVVVDLRIPGPGGEQLGGLELIDRSLQLDRLRPVIVMTGYGSVDLARRTLTRGVFDFIEKSSRSIDDLVDAIRRAVQARNEKIIRSGNPFTPITGTGPTVLGGRLKELEFFEERLNRALNSRVCEHFLVLGKWGIGKSTLLREYKRISQSRGYITCVVPLEPLQANTTLLEAAVSMVGGVIRDLPQPIGSYREVLEFFDSVGISVLGTGLRLKRDTAGKDFSAQSFLYDTFVRLWAELENKTEAFVLLFDDADYFSPVPEILSTLKQTLSMSKLMQSKILVGIAFTPAGWLKLTREERHHPLSRYFLRRVEPGPLSRFEMEETVYKALDGTGVSLSSSLVARVFDYTQGHPFEMQVLCYHLFEKQLSWRVEEDVWDKALESALVDLGRAVFEQWLGRAVGEEAVLLSILAEKDEAATTEEIEADWKSMRGGVRSGACAEHLQQLWEKGLVGRAGLGRYTIADRMFRAFVHAQSASA